MPETHSEPLWLIADGTRADVTDLVALDARNFARGDRFDRRLWRTILSGRTARNRLLTLVAYHQGVMVGAIVGEFRAAERRLVVWSIAVDEPHRGSGLARRLMAELVGRTSPAFDTVSLDARRDNDRARRFYARLGFRQVGETPHGYGDGTDAIRYETSLDDLRQALAAQAALSALAANAPSGSGANRAPEPLSGE